MGGSDNEAHTPTRRGWNRSTGEGSHRKKKKRFQETVKNCTVTPPLRQREERTIHIDVTHPQNNFYAVLDCPISNLSTPIAVGTPGYQIVLAMCDPPDDSCWAFLADLKARLTPKHVMEIGVHAQGRDANIA